MGGCRGLDSSFEGVVAILSAPTNGGSPLFKIRPGRPAFYMRFGIMTGWKHGVARLLSPIGTVWKGAGSGAQETLEA